MAFPQIEPLSSDDADKFFGGQYSSAAVHDGMVVGLYILHPNNVGSAGHIANASYAVLKDARGLHIGEALVKDSLIQAKAPRVPHTSVQRRGGIERTCHRLIYLARFHRPRHNPRRIPQQKRSL
jgi:hypothetical protein